MTLQTVCMGSGLVSVPVRLFVGTKDKTILVSSTFIFNALFK